MLNLEGVGTHRFFPTRNDFEKTVGETRFRWSRAGREFQELEDEVAKTGSMVSWMQP